MKPISPLAGTAAPLAQGPESAATLDARAQALAAAWRAGMVDLALRGKNLGLFCDDPERPEALLLQRAVAELGAHVALVKSRLDVANDPQELPQTARMLDRLYDAIVCVGILPERVQQMREAASIPVLDDVMAASRRGVGDGAPLGDDDARFRAQAILLGLLT